MLKIWANGAISSYTPCQTRRYNSIQQAVAANTKKTFRLKWKHYKSIASACVKMYETRQNNLTFWTFTYGKNESYKEAVKSFSKFLENFRKTHGCTAYVWTGELQKCGNPHFHLVADVPYLCLRAVTKSFCKARGYYSNSAVRLPKNKEGKTDRSVVRNVGSLVRYMCKYMVKGCKDGKDMGARCYAMSSHLTNAFEIIKDPETSSIVLSDIARSGYWAEFKMEYCTMFSPVKRLEDIREMLDSILNFSIQKPDFG